MGIREYCMLASLERFRALSQNFASIGVGSFKNVCSKQRASSRWDAHKKRQRWHSTFLSPRVRIALLENEHVGKWMSSGTSLEACEGVTSNAIHFCSRFSLGLLLLVRENLKRKVPTLGKLKLLANVCLYYATCSFFTKIYALGCFHPGRPRIVTKLMSSRRSCLHISTQQIFEAFIMYP